MTARGHITCIVISVSGEYDSAIGLECLGSASFRGWVLLEMGREKVRETNWAGELAAREIAGAGQLRS